MYGYYAQYCKCEDEPVVIGMANLQGVETTSYPVDVYNVNEELIGIANDRDEYISIWNADEDNQAVGILSTGISNFSFRLKLNAGQEAPDYVFGVPLSGKEQLGIYEIAYADEYE